MVRSLIRTLKYRVLRHLPGLRGYRYECKLMLRTNGFELAAERCRGTTCIDLGANLGTYTRLMAEHAKQVIAFEPDPWTLERLRSNLAHTENVKIVSAAAGMVDGYVELYRHEQFQENPVSYSISSSVFRNKPNVCGKVGIQVQQVDFIRYLEEIDDNIGILKIDIEGAEVSLLEALFERSDLMARISYIFAETHEFILPSLRPRVRELRARACNLAHPVVNLYWQ